MFIALTISLNIRAGRREPLDTRCIDAIPPPLFTAGPRTNSAMVMPSQKATTLYVPSNAHRPQYVFSQYCKQVHSTSRMN